MKLTSIFLYLYTIFKKTNLINIQSQLVFNFLVNRKFIK